MPRRRCSTASARRAITLSFVEPYLLGYRVALGVDLFSRIQKATNFVSYETRTTGGGLRFGFTLREDLSLQLRYSLFSQKIDLPQHLRNCNNLNPELHRTAFPTPAQSRHDRSGDRPCRLRRTASRTAKRRSRCAANWRRAPSSRRWSATTSPTTRSTTTATRPAACSAS